MSPRRFHTVAMVLGIVLASELVFAGMDGTFAFANGTSSNTGNGVGAGTLTLAATAPASGTTTCESWGGTIGNPSGNANPSCGTISVAGGPLAPGQSTTATLRVENTGSLNAADLAVLAPRACTSSSGSHPLCTVLEVYVEQTSQSGTPIACYYPTVSSGACTFDSYSSPGGAGTASSFSTSHFTSVTRLVLGGGLASLATRYFTIGLELPAFASPASGNAYQGQTATLALTWVLGQAGP